MGVEPDERFERQSEQQARNRAWAYEKVTGDISMIQRLVDAHWNENEFLIIRPGQRVRAVYDEFIVDVESLAPGPNTKRSRSPRPTTGDGNLPG